MIWRHLKTKQLSNAVPYGDNWLRFFVEWRVKAELNHEETTTNLKQSFLEAQKCFEQSSKQNAQQAQVIMETQRVQLGKFELRINKLKDYLSYLQPREVERQVALKQAAEKKARIAHRVKVPVRDLASYPEFKCALSIIDRITPEKNVFTRARDKVALLILYCTGIRLGNLLYCNVNHLDAFLNQDVFRITFIKSTKLKILEWPITSNTTRLAQDLRDELLMLYQGKTGTDPIFTAQHSKKPLPRTTLYSRVNNILDMVSMEIKKYLSSRSFRIDQTTALIKVSGIPKAQQTKGYADISTTAIYNRHHLS